MRKRKIIKKCDDRLRKELINELRQFTCHLFAKKLLLEEYSDATQLFANALVRQNTLTAHFVRVYRCTCTDEKSFLADEVAF